MNNPIYLIRRDDFYPYILIIGNSITAHITVNGFLLKSDEISHNLPELQIGKKYEVLDLKVKMSKVGKLRLGPSSLITSILGYDFKGFVEPYCVGIEIIHLKLKE
jgi:hypothetical protein